MQEFDYSKACIFFVKKLLLLYNIRRIVADYKIQAILGRGV